MGGNLLAIGDEEGIVSILDTSRPRPLALSRGKANAQWLGHQNAIFGLQWYQASTIPPILISMEFTGFVIASFQVLVELQIITLCRFWQQRYSVFAVSLTRMMIHLTLCTEYVGG